MPNFQNIWIYLKVYKILNIDKAKTINVLKSQIQRFDIQIDSDTKIEKKSVFLAIDIDVVQSKNNLRIIFRWPF